MSTVAPPADLPARRRPRNLALAIVEAIGHRIREGRLALGDKLPTEAELMAEFQVSRTVVREALSRLQAAALVETRHGIGTFVLGPGEGVGFQLSPALFETLQDVIAVLELRIGIETEASALAATRRTPSHLARMRSALDAFAAALAAGQDAVTSDFQFHLEVARATQNAHFSDLMATLGATIIPRARLDIGATSAIDAAASPELGDERRDYLRRVHGEHESIFDAISRQDPEAARAAMRTHLANSRERRRRVGPAGGAS